MGILNLRHGIVSCALVQLKINSLCVMYPGPICSFLVEDLLFEKRGNLKTELCKRKKGEKVSICRCLLSFWFGCFFCLYNMIYCLFEHVFQSKLHVLRHCSFVDPIRAVGCRSC